MTEIYKLLDLNLNTYFCASYMDYPNDLISYLNVVQVLDIATEFDFNVNNYWRFEYK